MALKGLRVPTHRIDVPGQYVFPWDDAWDVERIRAERDLLAEQALAKLKTEAVEKMRAELGRDLTNEERATAEESCALTEDERRQAEEQHPVPRYTSGEARYDPAAMDQGPHGPARAWDYFREGTDATVFTLRRVGYQTRMRLEALALRDPFGAHAAWVKGGVESISCGSDTLWKSTPQEPELSDDWLEVIAENDAGAFLSIFTLAEAVRRYNAPLSKAETFR
jgi:hypothetical protein